MKNLFKFTLPLLLLVGMISCSKIEEDTPNPFTPGTVALDPNEISQFHASIDGIPFAFTLPGVGIDTTAETGWTIGGDTLGRIYKSFLVDTVLGQPAVAVYLGKNSFILNTTSNPVHILPTESEFKTFFTQGSGYRTFSDTTEDMDGAAFFWRDTVNNVTWSTLGPQNGSSFHIDTIAPVTLFGQYHVKARMSFKCTLYDGNGAIRNLTNGVFIGVFRNG